MSMDISTFLAASAGAISILSSAYFGYRHIRYSIKNKKDLERQAILDKANEEMAKVEAELEKKIAALKQEFDTYKMGLSKDLDFMRSTYNTEIKNLGEKIENLRSDLGDQHTQMVSLLTKLVGKS